MATCWDRGVTMTKPLDPETTEHTETLATNGYHRAAAHMRKLAGENAELRADIAHCESGKDRDRQLRDDARAERDAAQRELAEARELISVLQAGRDQRDAVIDAHELINKALQKELAETKAELERLRGTANHEYLVTRVWCSAVGVDAALIPENHRPCGTGWDLVGFSTVGNQVFYCWKRNKP